MVSYLVYKNIHLIGVFMILMAVGGLLLHCITGGRQEHSWRRPVVVTHGVGLLLVLLGGFGMLARIGIFWSWPGWVMGKIIIWVIFGGLVGVIFRKPVLARSLWWVAIALAGLAAYLAGHKPF
jgi:hypothetical protein